MAGVGKGNIPLETLAKHFEAYNRSEGKSQQTVLWYSRVLRYFGDYLRGQGLPHTLENLDVGVVREFILYLQTKKKWEGHPCATSEENLRAISIQTYVRGLKSFFGWLHREGYTAENVLGNLRVPKAPQKLADVIRDDEVSRILACLLTRRPLRGAAILPS